MKRYYGLNVCLHDQDDTIPFLDALSLGTIQVWAWDPSGAKRGPFRIVSSENGRIEWEPLSDSAAAFYEALFAQAPCEIELHLGHRVRQGLIEVREA